VKPPFDLMLVVDPRVDGVLDALARLAVLARGDRIAVQLRAKDASDAVLIALARSIAAVQPAMSRLIVNGRADVARMIAADGVHLPESAPSAVDVRSTLPPGALVGASCHDEASLRRRAGEDVDYVLAGPIGDVPGKPAMPMETFVRMKRACDVPVFALGGIDDAVSADRAIELGASGIAVQRALLDPDGPAWLARWLVRRLAA
jgi:thiamine-phosphate diphosphorylase